MPFHDFGLSFFQNSVIASSFKKEMRQLVVPLSFVNTVINFDNIKNGTCFSGSSVHLKSSNEIPLDIELTELKQRIQLSPEFIHCETLITTNENSTLQLDLWHCGDCVLRMNFGKVFQKRSM